MTKIEFTTFLESSLTFLDPKDKKCVLDFFQEKFSFCSCVEEEQAIIEAFGSSEEFLENLKNENTSKTDESFDAKKYLETTLRNSLKSDDEKDEDSDLIFSKPIQIEKASKVVHSLEDHEVKTLYGEKVVIEKDDNASVQEKIVEPIDEANGLTTEEINLAKAKTLEKTESFSHEKTESDKQESDTKIPLEEEEHDHGTEPDEKVTPTKKEYFGIINKIIPSEKYNKKTRLTLLILLSLAISPILLFILGLFLGVYFALVALTAVAVATLFLAMIAIVALGVVELVHGFLVLFDSVAAALIELGFGTVLFSLVIAIAALIYEIIFGIVPKWIKWLTKVFIYYAKLLYCFLYGGKA